MKRLELFIGIFFCGISIFMATAYSVGLVIAYLEKVSHQELGSYWFYSALPILFLLVGSTCIAHAFPKAKDSEAESKKLKSDLPTTPNS